MEATQIIDGAAVEVDRSGVGHCAGRKQREEEALALVADVRAVAQGTATRDQDLLIYRLFGMPNLETPVGTAYAEGIAAGMSILLSWLRD